MEASDIPLGDLVAGVVDGVAGGLSNLTLEGLVAGITEVVANVTTTEETGDGFVFTDDLDYMSSIAGSALSLLLSLFICLASAWIYSVPSARHHLNRVSFRLLLWSMVVEVVYNITYICLFVDPLAPMSNPTSCGAGFYFLVASMGAANWLCTFIGVNLMLAICFGINPIRARLERWYIFASFFLSFGISIIFAALGHFGVDTVYQECYFTNADAGGRIRDFVVDLVLFTLLRQSRATGRALFRANDLNITPSDLSDISSSFPEDRPRRSLLPSFLRRLRPAATLHRLEDKFMSIALKISLYPIALIIINSIITAIDLEYTVQGGLESQVQYVAYCIYYFLYGGRGIFFALLGIFVDPCLRQGLPAAYKATFGKHRHVEGAHISETTDMDPESAAPAQSLSDFLSSKGGESGPGVSLSDHQGADGEREERPMRGWRCLFRRAATGRSRQAETEWRSSGAAGATSESKADPTISFTPLTPILAYPNSQISTYEPPPPNPVPPPPLDQRSSEPNPPSALQPVQARPHGTNGPDSAGLGSAGWTMGLRRASHPVNPTRPPSDLDRHRRRSEIHKAYTDIQAQL